MHQPLLIFATAFALLVPRSASAQRITADSVVRVRFVAGDSIQSAVGRLLAVTPDAVVLRIGSDRSRTTLDRSQVTEVEQRNPRRVGHSAAVGCAVVGLPIVALGIIATASAHGGDGDAGVAPAALTVMGAVGGGGVGAVVGALIGLSPGWHQVSISSTPRSAP